MGNKRLYLIDATAFCYRAYYALRDLSTSFGQPTNAIYGFLNIFNKIIKEQNPQYLAACFDVSRETFRTKKFAEYKIQRPPMPDGLSSQIPLIKEIIAAYGISIFEKEGFEADDIIATLSKKAKAKGLSVVIVSSDKDILQLVDPDITVFSPHKDQDLLYDEKKVYERFGVKPQRIADIIALMGDDVDNIPGVSGIGEKTATQLISDFGSLDKLLENIGEIKQERVRKAIQENLKLVNLNKELAVLDEDVEIDFDLEKLLIGKPNTQELFRLFRYLEFKKLLKNLPPEEEKPTETKIARISDEGIKQMVKRGDALFLHGLTCEELVFSAGDKCFVLDHCGSHTKAVLSDPQIKKIGHDLKKIKVSLAEQGVILEGLYFDTMIAAYLLNPSQTQYDLNDLAWEYLAKPLNAKISDKIQALELILQLKPKLELELQEKSLSGLFSSLEMPLVSVLAEMELDGIKLDLEVLRHLSSDIEKRLVILIKEIYTFSDSEFNLNSPKQLREVLFEKLKLPVIKKTKTGPSTDEEVLRNLAQQHKLPALLLEYRQLIKLKNTYIDVLPELVDKKTGRVHSSFNQTGTETGRLSSSNPNLQNIPVKTDIGRNIRRAVIASAEDNWLLAFDYSQIELRILAHLSKDANLISAFGKGEDIHKATASLIYGLEEKDITEPMREVAKRVNFGIVYGLSAYGLSRDLQISLEEAQRFIDAYFLRYPQVKIYIEEQIKKARTNGFVTTVLGRRRYIPEINNKNQGIRQFAERQAVNTPIQGSASDLIKSAMVQIHQRTQSKNLKGRMIMQIHDELVFDVPKQELQELLGLVKESMEQVLILDVPIKVEVKKGKNWMETEEAK